MGFPDLKGSMAIAAAAVAAVVVAEPFTAGRAMAVIDNVFAYIGFRSSYSFLLQEPIHYDYWRWCAERLKIATGPRGCIPLFSACEV